MSRRCHFAHVFSWLSVCLAVGIALSSCTREPTHVSMREVPPPTGGTPLAVVCNDAGYVAAPTGNGLYVRDSNAGDKRWRRIDISWPEKVERPSQTPTESLETSLSGLGFAGDQRFTAHRGRFWLIARPGPDRAPKLLVSNASGENWQTHDLPPMYAQGEQLRSAADSSPTQRLRLLDYGDDGLFLLDQQRIWAWVGDEATLSRRFTNEDTGVDARTPDIGQIGSDVGTRQVTPRDRDAGWRRIDILDLRRSGTTHQLPPAVRHYVPSGEHRPFELLTVFSDQLYVYRRWQHANRWVLISTLSTADRQIRTLPDGSVAMLAGDTVRRSMQEAEQWETLDVRRPGTPPGEPGDDVDVTTFEVTHAGNDSPMTTTFFAGTRHGAIYKTNQHGRAWHQVRPRDRDRRRVTDLASCESSMWAGFVGLGLTQSTDAGETWQPSIAGFRASEPLDVGIGVNGELLVATRAGLFRLTGRPRQGNYEAIHARATSALTVSPDGNWVVSGTLPGDIVVQTPEGRLRTFQTRGAPSQGVRVRPPRTLGQRLPDSAIVDFAGRPGTAALYAIPGRGPLWHATDEPLDWRPEPIPAALRSTLRHTIVTDVLAEFGEGADRLYLVSRGLRRSDRIRLWSSSRNERWRSITTFGPEPSPGRRLFDVTSDGTLYTASSGRLQGSTDGGRTWRTVAGPWPGNDPLMGYEASEDGHVLIHRTQTATLLRVLEFPDTDDTSEPPRAPRVRSERQLEFSWRRADTLPVSPIADVARFESSLFLTTGRTVFFGTIPPERVQIPHGPTIAITIMMLVVLASLSFVFLHQQRQ